MDTLPGGPAWQSTTLEIPGCKMTHPICLMWRNAQEVVEDILCNSIFVNYMTFNPHIVTHNSHREYGEFLTANWAQHIQVILSIDHSKVHPSTPSTTGPATWRFNNNTNYNFVRQDYSNTSHGSIGDAPSFHDNWKHTIQHENAGDILCLVLCGIHPNSRIQNPLWFPVTTICSSLSSLSGYHVHLPQGSCRTRCSNDQCSWIHLQMLHKAGWLHRQSTWTTDGHMHCKECLPCYHCHCFWVWWLLPTSTLIQCWNMAKDQWYLHSRCLFLGCCCISSESESDQVIRHTSPLLAWLEVCEPHVLSNWQAPPLWT